MDNYQGFCGEWVVTIKELKGLIGVAQDRYGSSPNYAFFLLAVVVASAMVAMLDQMYRKY